MTIFRYAGGSTGRATSAGAPLEGGEGRNWRDGGQKAEAGGVVGVEGQLEGAGKKVRPVA
eukprot:1177028-Prorocentrum_minimum.AAC.2